MVERSETLEKMAERSEAMVGAAEMPASNPLVALADRGLEAGRASGREPRKQDPEVVPKAHRRQFTAAYKLKILREAGVCTERGEIGALLRREGLYASQLTDWRQAVAAGLEPVQRGPKVKQVDPALVAQIKALRKENAHLNRQLQRAELILDIQKKVAILMENPLTKPDFGADS